MEESRAACSLSGGTASRRGTAPLDVMSCGAVCRSVLVVVVLCFFLLCFFVSFPFYLPLPLSLSDLSRSSSHCRHMVVYCSVENRVNLLDFDRGIWAILRVHIAVWVPNWVIFAAAV